ncbi:MAG: trypsin-like peptidase domain-containing protein [Xanthomonadaceae bacterium]|nr:trypsin-like peptidase domain-containing protein [Xanthomonadaceae bacterium]
MNLIQILLSAMTLHTSHASGILSTELPDLVEKIQAGVVNISSTTVQTVMVHGWDMFLQERGIPKERKQTSLGSGFIIDKEGYIITNNHVVDHADEVVVTLQNKKQYRAKLIGKDAKMDIALIQIRDDSKKIPENLTANTLGDSDKARIAEPVLAIGNPFGLSHTVTTGILSAKNRAIGLGPFDNFLQTDAAINPGNSGGPLFNFKGEVIGINTVIFSKTGQSGGLGFAIPINEAKTILADLKKFGRVPRAWLGVLTEKVTPQMAGYYRLGRDDGVVIYNMVEGGPADQAGIQPGDIIIKVGSEKIEEVVDLERLISKLKPKDTVNLTLQRGRKQLTKTIKLDELPAKQNRLPEGII